MTRPMTVGAVADCITFGNRGYACYPGKVRNGKEWDAFRDEHRGKILCITSELDDARGAAMAVQADPEATRWLSGCEFQRVMQAEMAGLPCGAGIPGQRGGFDAIHYEQRHIADMKITSCVEPVELGKHAFRMKWHNQGAWYIDMARASGLVVDRFVLIAVEANPPHVVTCLEVPERLIEAGRRENRAWLERIRSCEASGLWPGYVQTTTEMQIPESWEEGY